MNGNTNALHDSPPSQGPTTRRPVASTSSNRKTADGSNVVERGESTPHAFAPCNPTPEDPGWPPWLENSIQRLVSAVRETSPPRAHSSAPPTPPGANVDNTTPTGTTVEGNTLSAKDDKVQQRPANRDTHPSGASQPQRPTITIDRDSVTHDTSGEHSPGGQEMRVKDIIDTHHKVLPTIEHSDRQPPNSPTAWLHAYPSSPPDEDKLPKRVADSERYQQQQDPTRVDLPLPSKHPEERHHKSIRHSQPRVTAKATTCATVTKPNSSLSPLRSSTEQEGAQNSCPLSAVTEETVDLPVHPPAKHYTIALAQTRITLDNMNQKIIKCLNQTQHIVTHRNNIITSVDNSTNITNIISIAESDYNVKRHSIENLIKNPLLRCIEEHYSILEREKYQTCIQIMTETHLSLVNNPLCHCLADNAGPMIEDTITNAIQYWQHTKSNDLNTHSVTYTHGID